MFHRFLNEIFAENCLQFLNWLAKTALEMFIGKICWKILLRVVLRMVFDCWASKFRTFSKKIFSWSFIITFHASRFFFRDEIYIYIFWPNLIFGIFFRALLLKFETFGGNFSTVILTLHSSCEEGKLKGKNFRENCSRVFFRIFSLRDFVLLANFFSRGVRNAFHVSRVPFRENFYLVK